MPWNYLLLLVEGQHMRLSGGPGGFTRAQARAVVALMLKDNLRDDESLIKWTQKDQDMLIVAPLGQAFGYAVWAVYPYEQDRYTAALSWVREYCRDAGIDVRIWQFDGVESKAINPSY